MKSFNIKAGDVFPTNEGCRVVVIEYRGWKEIEIEHIDAHQHRDIVRADNLRNGKVKNPFYQSSFGVGYFGAGCYKSAAGGNHTPAYNSWNRMMQRCYSAEYHARKPTYAFCSVITEWHNFQVFAEWHDREPNSGSQGFHLDKDLRVGGNKVYGPDTCSFVPAPINSLLTDSAASRGSLPQGVSPHIKGLQSTLRVKGKNFLLGIYATTDQAFSVYKKAKEVNVRSMAEEWRECLHPEVYDYLKSWTLK